MIIICAIAADCVVAITEVVNICIVSAAEIHDIVSLAALKSFAAQTSDQEIIRDRANDGFDGYKMINSAIDDLYVAEIGLRRSHKTCQIDLDARAI